jgi:hypothetical protein
MKMRAYFAKMRGATRGSPPQVGHAEIFWSWVGGFIGISAVSWANLAFIQTYDLTLMVGSFGFSTPISLFHLVVDGRGTDSQELDQRTRSSTQAAHILGRNPDLHVQLLRASTPCTGRVVPMSRWRHIGRGCEDGVNARPDRSHVIADTSLM